MISPFDEWVLSRMLPDVTSACDEDTKTTMTAHITSAMKDGTAIKFFLLTYNTHTPRVTLLTYITLLVITLLNQI